jgi:hypothetical protein
MAQKQSKIHVKISDYSSAQRIADTYTERDNQYLLNLIKSFVPEDKQPSINITGGCSPSDRKVLLRYGNKIKGVAEKMLKSKQSSLEKKTEDEQLILSGF